MAPIIPHWARPSHPEIQEVEINEAEFTSLSRSRVEVPPFAVFAKMTLPPCTVAVGGPTYATVQVGRDRHLNLNSDLVYINHSCEPSLIFDTANLNILAGPKGLQPGDELTFFYPSTEWSMAQPFECQCGTASCCGLIRGAADMPARQLAGRWVNGHVLDMMEGREREAVAGPSRNGNGVGGGSLGKDRQDDMTARAMRDALRQAELAVEAATEALMSYIAGIRGSGGTVRRMVRGDGKRCVYYYQPLSPESDTVAGGVYSHHQRREPPQDVGRDGPRYDDDDDDDLRLEQLGREDGGGGGGSVCEGGKAWMRDAEWGDMVRSMEKEEPEHWRTQSL
ncbi:hypothetical protein RB593_007234 [Gaeumannomyces tritici]